MSFSIKFTALFIAAFTYLAQADYKEFHYQRTLESGIPTLMPDGIFKWLPPLIGSSYETDKIEEATYEQRLDHNSCCDITTFDQRYYYDGTLAKGKDSPVFLYICGESTCEPRSLEGAIREHAKSVGAHLIALEHRYYGKSQPFTKLTVQNMKYLTTEYALKDLAAFAQFAKDKYGLKGKWVSFGGSYPGSLSAYLREKLPELVVGAIASSAPVRAEANFEEYDLHVSQVAGEACAAAVRKAVAGIDALVGKPEMAEVKKLFGAEKVKDDTDFLYVIADIGAAAVQYGFHKDFCAAVQTEASVSGYGKFAETVYKKFGMAAERMSMYEGAISEDPEDYLEGFGYRQWLYQSCTEYGYWQNAYHDANVSVRSARINAAYHDKLCQRLFGLSPVDTSTINEGFYKPLFASSTTNILFTNGNQDPWSRLSIVQGTSQQSANLTLYKIEGAAHCDDLRKPKDTDSDALKGSRTLTLQLIGQWLGSN